MKNRHIRFVSIALAAAVLLPLQAAAQTAAAPPRPDQVESDPIRCWWKSDRTAVRVGERFNIVLTCGVIETGPITVVPAANQLEAGAIQLTPFEVVSGLRREDIVSAPWRYLQFEYVVRLMNDGFFGQDVNVPALTVTYNLQAAGGSTQGREQSYVLPALPMRILSVVPRSAADIRDASAESFGAIESRRFRGSAATVAGFIAFAFAAVLAVMAVVRATGRYRARDTARVKPVPAPSMLGGCLRALSDVREEAARGGWTPELMRRALAALRVAGAVALDRDVSQTYVGRHTPPREGQLAIRTGFLRRKRAVLSAPTTSRMITAHLNGRANGNGSANGSPPRPGTRARASLQALDEALRVFSAATYGRNGKPDGDALTTALDDGARAVKRLRVGAMWPVRAAEAVTRSFAGY